MAEDKKPQEPEDKKDSFVEIDGKKFKEDPENKGQPLKDDKGESIPFEEKKEEHIDYKAEFEKEKVRREQADHTIEELKRRKKEEEEGEGGDGKEGMTPEEIRKIAQEEASKTLKSINQGQAENLARSVATSDDEAELIIFHYKNSIVLTGNLQEDIESAQALANKKRVQKQLSEIRRTIQAKKNEAGEGGAGNPPGGEEESEPKLSENDRKIIRSGNFKWDPKKKVFISPSGREWNPKAS